MKRVTCFLLCLIWLALSCTAAVCAVNAPVFTVGSVQGYAGETVDVPITLTANDGLIGCIISVSYDASVLTLTGVGTNIDFSGSFEHSYGLTANPFNVIWCDALATANHTQSGVLCILHFAVSAEAPAGEYPLTLSYDANSTFDVDLQSVACTVENGSLTVLPQETGGWHFSENSTLRLWTDGTKSYVIGLDGDDPVVTGFVETTGGWSYTVTKNRMGAESTAAVLSIFDENDMLAEQYDVVVFGDIDGDGQCTIDDANEIIAYVCYDNTEDWAQFVSITDNACAMAADLEHDGMVDICDANEMVAIVQYLQKANQLWMSETDPGSIILDW